jgi:hypothetical protein
MRFPIDDLLSNQECCRYLREQLHPDGLSCPNGHELPDDRSPHDRKQAPILNYRCPECGRVFNILTDTVWEKTQQRHPHTTVGFQHLPDSIVTLIDRSPPPLGEVVHNCSRIALEDTVRPAGLTV